MITTGRFIHDNDKETLTMIPDNPKFPHMQPTTIRPLNERDVGPVEGAESDLESCTLWFNRDSVLSTLSGKAAKL